MNSPNYDGSGGDFESWDGRSELDWTEKNWKQFLKESDSEIGRFIRTYQTLRGDPQRLDHTAVAMNWDTNDWSLEGEESDERADWQDGMSDEEEDDDEDFEDMVDNDPYTVHRHPLYVSTRAFYCLFSHYWRMITHESPQCMPLMDCHCFGESLRAGEMNAIMAIHALEMADYALVVCHLQRALSALNDSLHLFQKVCAAEKCPVDADFIEEFHAWFFDLREVWLRVMRECRNPEGPR